MPSAGDTSTGGPADVDSSGDGEATEADDGSSGGTTGDPMPPPPDGPRVPPRTDGRTCLFGAASSGDWIAPPGGAGVAPDVPMRLSDAHCFADLPHLQPAADVVPYELNSPLWTDGAHKHRYFVLPPDETIRVSSDGRFTFPTGSAILKVFAPERVVGDPASAVPVETRVMVRREHDWEFFTYRWDEDGLDATLIEGGDVVEIPRTQDGEAAPLSYYFPDEEACRICHRWEDGGQVLGPRTAQMNRVLEYAEGPKNQLETLWDEGWLSGEPLADVLGQPVLADPADESVAIELRARAYLHGNCSHCHREGGWQPVGLGIDLRHDVPLADTQICGVPIEYWSPWAGGSMRIAPGDPDDSNILQRMSVRGNGQMPLVGTYVVDPLGIEVLQAWIEDLGDCPAPS